MPKSINLSYSIYSLVSGHSHSARGFGFFDVMVDLTQEGFDQVDEILKIIFEVTLIVFKNYIKFGEIKTFNCSTYI